TPDREWHLTKTISDLPPQHWITDLAQVVAELDYHLEEVFKATNEQLDWNNPEGTSYPHNLIISLKIMQFFGYSHLEEITVHGQDDVIYKFREGDFKRLRRQDIEDMLLLLVQGKLTNLSLDERYALNVALRIKMTPYTGYPDVQGIIYQDELSRNRLMRTDELHKFSDGTLNHVRTALNDIATRSQMDYLLKRRWSPQDKMRARVMISAIDRKLRDRRLMRSLEKFVGGRPYGGDLRLLERTILFIICCPHLYQVNPST
ncbi:hypothetical protein Tco_0281049, partial [Tanacetum coccineum]